MAKELEMAEVAIGETLLRKSTVITDHNGNTAPGLGISISKQAMDDIEQSEAAYKAAEIHVGTLTMK